MSAFPFVLVDFQSGLDSNLSGFLGLTLASPTATSSDPGSYKLNEKIIDYLKSDG